VDLGVALEPVSGELPDGLSRLRIEVGVDGSRSTVRLLVDGADLLASQQSQVFADGRVRPAVPMRFDPPDPTDLLPPDAAVLLLTAAGSAAMVGVCTCGELGCGSLWLRVSRDGGTVVWGPDPDAAGDTVDRSWRFDLLRYLDAVDTAAAAALAGEDQPRRLARELRHRREALHRFVFARPGIRLLDARAWAGVPEVQLTVASPAGVRWPAVGVVDGESVAESCLRVAHLDPDHPPTVPPVRRNPARRDLRRRDSGVA